MTDPRKLLARLEPQSRNATPSKRRGDVGTSRDARLHAPPDDKKSRRQKRIIDVLRMHLWHGASRAYTPAGTRSLKDPDASENIDIAGALAMAARGSATRALAVNVYLYRNWPHYAERSKQSMEYLVTLLLIGRIHEDQFEPWVRKLRKHKDRGDALIERMVRSVLDEFGKATHCEACGGHGTEQTGIRVGEPCVKCRGSALVQWSDNARAAAVRVRRDDWVIWKIPYLHLLDFLISLDRSGSRAHARAMAA